MTEALRPWSGLQPGVATLLRPALPAAIDGSIAAIDRELPAFRAGLDGDLGRTVRRGVEIALNRLLDLMGTDRPALDARARHVYETLGEGEGAQGRSLDTLLAAYRIGARVTWADLAAAAVRGGVGTDQLVLLAEAIFVYIDELSAASASGFARRQAADAGHRDVLRSRLAEALIDGDAASALPRVRRLAEDAAWPIPERLTVALVNLPGGGEGPPAAAKADPEVLILAKGPDLIALIAEPALPGLAASLAGRFGATGVFLGTTRAPGQAPLSLAHARAVRRLALQGVLPDGGLVAAADHLAALVVHADPTLLDDLARQALAPLDSVAPARRAVLEETLAAWLAHQGERAQVAAALTVHPQTVSYRLGRLAELFGAALRDPATRLALTLALAGRPTRS
jgi:hypothetical protein